MEWNFAERWLKKIMPNRVRRVLVLEDDMTMEPLMNRAFKNEDKSIVVHWVSTVSQAEICLQKHDYDLVLADVLVHGAHTGIDLWEICSRVCPEIPFIFMSGLPREEVLSGISDLQKEPAYLEKPIRLAQCQSLIAKYLQLAA